MSVALSDHLDDPITLEEAASKWGGRLDDLYSELKKGRLRASFRDGYYWTTKADFDEMIRLCTIPRKPKIPQPTTTALYRHFDRSGKLLYVGIACDPIRRLKQHSYRYWYDRVTRVDIEHFESRKDALIAEARAIRIEQPEFNIQLSQ